MVICAILYTVTTFMYIFACTPREKIWNKLYTGGHCIKGYGATILFTAFLNILLNVAILVLPIRSVWILSLFSKKRVKVFLFFCVGTM
jgi:hypothetical protein